MEIFTEPNSNSRVIDEETMIDEFIVTYCAMCGSQRCDPKSREWRGGCTLWKQYISQLGKESKNEKSGKD